MDRRQWREVLTLASFMLSVIFITWGAASMNAASLLAGLVLLALVLLASER